MAAETGFHDFPKASEYDKLPINIKEVCCRTRRRMCLLMVEENEVSKYRIAGKYDKLQEPEELYKESYRKIKAYAYFGEKRGNQSRADFCLTNAFCINSARKRAAKKAVDAAVREENKGRNLEIYNLSMAIQTMATAPGVGVNASSVAKVLNHKKIMNEIKSFKNARQNDVLHKMYKCIPDLDSDFKKFHKFVQKRIKEFKHYPVKIDSVSSSIDDSIVSSIDSGSSSCKSMEVSNVNKKMFAKRYVDRLNRGKPIKKFKAMTHDFKELIVKRNSADACLSDYLMKYIPKLCRLNPEPSGPEPTLENY